MMKALSSVVVSVLLYISCSAAHAIPIEGWPPEFSPPPDDEWVSYPSFPPQVPDDGIDLSPWPDYPVPAVPLETRLEGQALYDPNLDITWARNAAIGGAMTWDATHIWLSSLELGGITGWRMPYTTEVVYLADNEGISVDTPEPFLGISTSYYFAEDEIFGDLVHPLMSFDSGDLTLLQLPVDEAYVIPVYDGDVDVSVIEEPATLVLIVGGLLGLMLAKRTHR
ncbi:hypothetical protein [Thiohalobacter thiocyanaticus]|nr:hypothetical protein [Thiohalobacter thiocyanaticus]